MVRIILLILGAILTVALTRMAFVVPATAGWTTGFEPTDNTACITLEIAPGTEDVTYDAVTGLVFVSTDDRRADGTSPGNGIWVFDPARPQATLRRVSADAPANFRPHGISLYRNDEVARLFVVSHPGEDHHILIYDVADDGMLTHVRTINDPAIYSPNDVAAVGPDTAYVTNSSYFGDNPLGVVEALLGLPLTNLVLVDGDEVTEAAGGFVYGNGVQISPDGTRLYAANFIGQKLYVYERDTATNALTKLDTWRAPFGLDNIELDGEANAWVAGNTEVFSFLAHQGDPSARAPSVAGYFDADTGEWTPTFATDGSDIDSLSVVTPVGDQVILGAVFDSHVLICPQAD
jgi:arylesterase/paraoxonase